MAATHLQWLQTIIFFNVCGVVIDLDPFVQVAASTSFFHIYIHEAIAGDVQICLLHCLLRCYDVCCRYSYHQ